MEKGTNFKYVVYCTTNKVNQKIYIGVHKTQNPDIFDGYIGCGIYNTQPHTYSNPKTNFQYAVKKHGVSNFERKIIAIFNTLEEASQLEYDLVDSKFLARNDVYNMCLGGCNSIGENNRISVYCYDSKGVFIKEYDSMLEAGIDNSVDYTAISYAVRNKTKSCNYYWSTDKLENLDLNLYNTINNNRMITYAYSNDGKFFKEYESQASASKELDMVISSICQAVQLGVKRKGFYFSTEKQDSFDKARSIQISKRAVYKYSVDGEFIEGFETQKEAELRHSYSNINKAIKLKSVCENNFMWSLEKLQNFNVPSKKFNSKKPVGKFDLNGVLVKKYESATQADKENGTSVWKVLKGINKTHKGHIYKYLDN